MLKEIVDRSRLAARCHQRLDANLIWLDVVARLAREDHQLALYILTGQVDVQIRLGQALLPRLAHQLGKKHRAVELQEHPRQRAEEDAADRPRRRYRADRAPCG